MINSAIDRQITLSDGRTLGFTESGSADGLPLLYFHGFPGSRREAGILCGDSASSDLHIIAIDRPGMGLSDFQANRTLKDWPNDIRELADQLGLRRFAVIGISGGGPYAVACAWALPELVICAGVVCAPTQLNEEEVLSKVSGANRSALKLIQRFPWLSKPTFATSAFILKHWPLMMLDSHAHSLPIRDQETLKEPDVRRCLSDSFVESLRHGSEGGAQELKILSSPWGFDPGQIQVPIALWHGELDTIVPVHMGRQISRRIPRCTASFFPEDGHYSILFKRRAVIMEQFRAMAQFTQ